MKPLKLIVFCHILSFPYSSVNVTSVYVTVVLASLNIITMVGMVEMF